MKILRYLKKIKDRKNIKRKEIRFEELSYEWLGYKKNMIKQSTYYNYMLIIEKYLNPKFSNIKVRKIRNYNDFVQELSNTLSSKTVRDIITVLKSILKYYVEEYNCELNVKKTSVPKIERKKLKVLTKKERKKLESVCLESKDLRDLGIVICLNTGLRIGEICALRWENINLEEKKIHVKKTVQRIYSKEKKLSKVIIDKPKTQCSIRTIPISNKLYNILKPIKKNFKKEDFFLSGSDRCIEPRNYQYYFKNLLNRCKIKPCNFHILRHTFATKCIEVGMDMKSLSEILGHADVNITLKVYVHSSDNLKKKFLEKL